MVLTRPCWWRLVGYYGGNLLGAVFSALGLVSGIWGSKAADSNKVSAYSYLFQAGCSFAR